ncbi:MAG TPA: sulfatase-like hydrolase/transferase [Kofleriaceae bacterium]|nr:sulfatase-like hydrolase/transferase [Kofleriaceae bacterium]
MSRARYRSVRAAIAADTGRAVVMTACGAVAFAPVEYVLTLRAYSGSIEMLSKLRLIALTLTLALWLWLVLSLALVGTMIAWRLWRYVFDPVAARRVGWFVPDDPDAEGVRPGVPRAWALFATLGIVALIIQHRSVWLTGEYQEVQLRGIYIARDALVAVAIGVPVHRLFGIATRVAARALAPVLGVFNPFGRWRAAGVAWTAIVAGALVAIWFVLPQSRSVLPVRLVVAGCLIALGMGMGAFFAPRFALRPRKRGTALAVAGCTLALTVVTLFRWGADVETKYVALTASPPMDNLIKLVRTANDLDRDGFGTVLGENDCNPFRASIHPGAPDSPDDEIDQNCDGRDFSLKNSATATGPAMPVPDQFKRSDWNVLFITIDTVRYDHTSFGGYKDKRDTTPRLAEFVKRSSSFTFCNAPSAGTMASIPAILTSKYFHSGIALDENRPAGTPPGIKPENTTLPEIMKRGGYHTGVIATHHWWNDWGFEQGVDEYDNSIGKANDPYLEPADKTTDHILAWVSRQQGHKWFLWAHYIDPHGRYVAHPDVVDYGSSDPDLYDVELRWTDQQIGRLLDELKRLPSDDHTIVIITSDHGESMGEHPSVPVGTHGTALYTELLHVPMIFYIPNLPPKQIGGAVTNLDIIPTIAQIADIDVKDLSFEGKSLVPELFYGKEDHERIVFSETNAPSPERAAVSEAYKLIYYLQSNIYELYDLKTDPAEKTNLASKSPDAMKMMKAALDAWIERVVYARDATFNQADKKMADLVLAGPPKPEVTTTGQTLDDGKLQILGISMADGSARPAPSASVAIDVFFKVQSRTQIGYKFLLAVWPVDTAVWKPTNATPSDLAKSAMRASGDGFFASDRWRTGEFIRDKFEVTIPSSWTGNGLAVGLVASDPHGEKAIATGDAPANDPNLIVLGVLPFQALPPPPPPTLAPSPASPPGQHLVLPRAPGLGAGSGQGSMGSSKP